MGSPLAMTTSPSLPTSREPTRHLGVADRVGSLEAGKDADVVIAGGDPMVSDTAIETVFLNGRRVVG